MKPKRAYLPCRDLAAAVAEAHRFLAVVATMEQVAEAHDKLKPGYRFGCNRRTAAVRRAALDLWRALPPLQVGDLVAPAHETATLNHTNAELP